MIINVRVACVENPSYLSPLNKPLLDCFLFFYFLLQFFYCNNVRVASVENPSYLSPLNKLLLVCFLFFDFLLQFLIFYCNFMDFRIYFVHIAIVINFKKGICTLF